MVDEKPRPEWAIRIRDARAAARLSQAQLGELTGLSQSAIADYERGRTRPGHDAYFRLSGALGKSANFLMFGESSKHIADRSAEAIGDVQQRRPIEWKDSNAYDGDWEFLVRPLLMGMLNKDDIKRELEVVLLARQLWTIALLLSPEIPLTERLELSLKQVVYMRSEKGEAPSRAAKVDEPKSGD